MNGDGDDRPRCPRDISNLPANLLRTSGFPCSVTIVMMRDAPERRRAAGRNEKSEGANSAGKGKNALRKK